MFYIEHVFVTGSNRAMCYGEQRRLLIQASHTKVGSTIQDLKQILFIQRGCAVAIMILSYDWGDQGSNPASVMEAHRILLASQSLFNSTYLTG